MLKNKKDHYVPDFEHHKHGHIKSHGGEDSFDPVHDFSPVQLGRQKIKDVKKFVNNQEDIRATILIGSYAKGEERNDSDVDFILLSKDRDKWIKDTKWTKKLGKVKSVTLENYEDVIAVRAYFADSVELEFGFVTDEWFLKPLKETTKEVVEGKYEILKDKDNLFQDILDF